MIAYRTSFFSVAAFLMLLCSTCIVSQRVAACPHPSASGPSSFTAAPGSSQNQIWTASSDFGDVIINITDGSDVFSVDQSAIFNPRDPTPFRITFSPPANSTGTFNGTLTISANGCTKTDLTFSLNGTVAASGVANVFSSEVSITVSPNPATNHLTVAALEVRSVKIGFYDLLGKEIASSKSANWELDASSFAPGPYIARIAGESNSGEEFVIWRRIIIAR